MRFPLPITPFQLVARCIVLTAACSATSMAQTAAFGEKNETQSALIGILYDLKQTQNRQPTGVTVGSYVGVVDDFLSKKWDESVLNHYYRVSRALYSTQIYIPLMDAGSAPKAFEAEKTVAPSRWLIHYKGQVAPPESGRYRFVGYADDWLAVAVNNQTVLVVGRPDMKFVKTAWSSKTSDGMNASNGRLRYGDWIDLKKDEAADIDIAIGERPGGNFAAFLLVQKEGEKYEMSPDGHPILPIFQLQARDTPAPAPRLGPPFATGAKPWKVLQ